jgi:hypothetical protein
MATLARQRCYCRGARCFQRRKCSSREEGAPLSSSRVHLPPRGALLRPCARRTWPRGRWLRSRATVLPPRDEALPAQDVLPSGGRDAAHVVARASSAEGSAPSTVGTPHLAEWTMATLEGNGATAEGRGACSAGRVALGWKERCPRRRACIFRRGEHFEDRGHDALGAMARWPRPRATVVTAVGRVLPTRSSVALGGRSASLDGRSVALGGRSAFLGGRRVALGERRVALGERCVALGLAWAASDGGEHSFRGGHDALGPKRRWPHRSAIASA